MTLKPDFDPNDVAERNGAFMALDCSVKDADLVIFPLPWDVTTSYRPGTADGPQAVIEASYQLDFSNPFRENAWELKIATAPFPKKWKTLSKTLRKKSSHYIRFLEDGGKIERSKKMGAILKECNHAGKKLHSWSQDEVRKLLKSGKKVITLGGDHSVSLGPILATAEHVGKLSILHFDAHADLRNAFEGFEDSHASILFNVMKSQKIEKLVQVGIRDYSPDEKKLIETDPRIHTHFDWDLKQAQFQGKPWDTVCDQIIADLGQQVYISFDIDGLDPKLCPNTGTPVPGGLELEQAVYLIQKVKRSGRKLVGADLVEVAPDPENPDNEWDGNVGARLLYQICLALSN